MNNLFKRFLIGLVFAIPIVGLALFFSGMSASAHPMSQSDPTCSGCHADVTSFWAQSKHGLATDDPVFVQEWEAQGQPGACLTCHVTGYDTQSGTWESDGIACQSCHTDVPKDHPRSNASMPIDNSTCVTCHNDPRFGEQWKLSTHYQMNMECSTCHDPHTTGMHQAPGSEEPNDPAALCMNCHRDYAEQYPHSTHAQAGVSCTSCHLGVTSEARAPHTVPDHSFTPKIESCNGCHALSMHNPVDGTAADIDLSEVDMALVAAAGIEEMQKTPILDQPVPVSPLGFAGLAGLLGLASGMVLAPWLERAYRNWNKGGKNDKH